MSLDLSLQVLQRSIWGWYYWRYMTVRFGDEDLRALAQALAVYAPPPKPGTPSVTLTGEDEMGLLYSLQLPPPGAPDVTSRTLEQTVDTNVTTYSATDGMILRFQQGQQVSLRVRDTDDQGNVSPWSEPLSFTATDTIKPPAPGQLGVTPTGEDGNMTDSGPAGPAA